MPRRMAVRAFSNPEENRPFDVRQANDRLAREAERLRFVARVPMLCECSDAGCEEIFLAALDDYRGVRADSRVFLTAPEHRVVGAELDRTDAEFWVQRAT
jgi:hypothetical protein